MCWVIDDGADTGFVTAEFRYIFSEGCQAQQPNGAVLAKGVIQVKT